MTRVEIKDRVRNNLNDLGITFYSESDLNDSIQDGYDEIVAYCEIIDKIIDITQSNTVYYDMTFFAPDYLKPSRVYNTNNKIYLEGLSDRNFLDIRQDWELASHSTREFMILGPKSLGFSGHSSNPTGTFRVSYKATAPVLTDSTVIKINSAYNLLLENYVTADLLEQNQEYVKADKYWKQYDSMLEDYRFKIKLLAKSDQVFTRV